MTATTEPLIERIEIHSLPRGTGFPAYVHRLAAELGIKSEVRDNDNDVVVITATGHAGDLAEFAGLVVQQAAAYASDEGFVVSSVPITTDSS